MYICICERERERREYRIVLEYIGKFKFLFEGVKSIKNKIFLDDNKYVLIKGIKYIFCF